MQEGDAEDSPESQQADTGDLVCPSPTPVESGGTMPYLSDCSNGGYGVFEAPFDTYSPLPYSASPSAATTLCTFSVAMPDLQSPVDIQFLWHHFVQHTAKGFLVWDPQTVFRDQDIKDPYAVGLPAMATSSLPLYYAALALSAFHYSSSTGDNTLSNLKKMFEQRAIRALSNPPSYTPPGPQHFLHTVTCIILLCVSSPGEYTDLLPLARSAAACLITNTSRARLDQDQRSVAMMLIRWCEVCVLCSPKLDAKLSEEPIHQLMECTVEEDDIGASGAFRNWIIHPLYGFSRRLVKPLLKVARLVRARQNEEISPGGYLGLEAEIDVLEIELLEARDADIAALSASQQDDCNLLHLNEAVYSAAVIIFYTRMRDMPWTSPLIRSHVQTACSELSHLDLQSPISRAVIFPYYVAGCEAVGSSTRETIRKQISHLPDTWFNRGSRILQCLEHVWAIRDEVPGAPWISWNRKGSYAMAKISKGCDANIFTMQCPRHMQIAYPVEIYREPQTFHLSQRNSNCTICHPAVSQHEKQSRRHMLPPYFPQQAPFPFLCLLYF